MAHSWLASGSASGLKQGLFLFLGTSKVFEGVQGVILLSSLNLEALTERQREADGN